MYLKTIYLLSATSILLFSGCGGGDSSSSSSKKEVLSSLDSSQVEEDSSSVSSNKTCDPTLKTWAEGYTTDEKYTAKGDIILICDRDEDETLFEGYSLSLGVSSLTIMEFTKTESAKGTEIIDSKKNKFSYTNKYNYKTGIIKYKMRSTDKDYDCKETYSPLTPETVTREDIYQLFTKRYNQSDIIDTTCPESHYAYTNYDDVNYSIKGELNVEYKLVDDEGKKHTVTKNTLISIEEI